MSEASLIRQAPAALSAISGMDTQSVAGVCRVGVDERAVQPGHGVGELVFGVVSDSVGILKAGAGIDVQFGVGV